jgi:type I restriction enzyme S subunit
MSDHWQQVSLAEICSVSAGNSAPQDPAYFAAGTIPFFRTSDAGRVKFGTIYESQDKLNAQGASKLRRYPAGTILFPKSGASTFLNHRVVLGVEGCVSSHLATIVPDLSQVLPQFLLYALTLIDAKDLIQDQSYPSLNLPAIEKICIHLPPIAEQQRIVRLLDEAFEGIAIAKVNAEKNLQNAHELLNSQMQALFGSVDNEWREVQLETLCTVDWGNTKLTKSAYVEGGEYLAVSAAGCDGRIGHKEHAKFTPVLSAIGAQCGRMFLPDEDFTAIKNTITLTPKDGTCTGKFLYRLLTYVELPKRGAAQPFISKGDIQTFSVNVPPLTTQDRVVELAEKLEKHTDKLAQVYGIKLAKLDVLKHSLLHQAITGDSKVLS